MAVVLETEGNMMVLESAEGITLHVVAMDARTWSLIHGDSIDVWHGDTDSVVAGVPWDHLSSVAMTGKIANGNHTLHLSSFNWQQAMLWQEADEEGVL
jgi:hypothetical protein